MARVLGDTKAMQDFGALSAEAGQFYALTYYAHAAIGFGAAQLA